MIKAYADTLMNIVAAASKALQPLVGLYVSGERDYIAKKALAEAMLPIVTEARAKTHQAAVKFTLRRAALAKVKIPGHLIPADPDPVTAADIVPLLFRSESEDPAIVAKSVIRHAATMVRAPDRQLPERLADLSPEEDDLFFDGDEDETFGDSLSEEIAEDRRRKLRKKQQQQRRKSNLASMPKQHRRRWRYARILTGKDDCAFCVMLASQGPVYSSARRAAGAEYHPGCDCLAIVVFLDQLDDKAKRDADIMYKLWQTAQDTVDGVEGTKNDALNRFRRYLAVQKLAIPHTVMN